MTFLQTGPSLLDLMKAGNHWISSWARGGSRLGGGQLTKEVQLIDEAGLRTRRITCADQVVDETIIQQVDQTLILLIVHTVAAGNVANVTLALGSLLQGLGVGRFGGGSSRCRGGKHEEVDNGGGIHLDGKKF